MQPLYCNVAADVTLMVTKYLVHEQASVHSRKAQWWKILNSLQTWRELFPFGGGGGLTAVTLPFTETNMKSSSRLLLNIIWKISVAFNTKTWWWWWYLKQKRTNLILFLVNYKGISWVWNSAQSKIHCRISLTLRSIESQIKSSNRYRIMILSGWWVHFWVPSFWSDFQ